MSAFEADSNNNAVLLIGPYRSGKTRCVLRSALRLKCQNPLAEVAIIVPSARYANLLRQRLPAELEALPLAERPAGIMGLKILPFYEACRSVLRQAGLECRHLADELRAVLVKNLLLEMSDGGELKALAPIAAFHGTVPSLVELLDEFQRAGLSPAEVLDQLERAASSESLFYELAQLYERYRQRCATLRVFDLKQVALEAREFLYAQEPDELPVLCDSNGIPFERVPATRDQGAQHCVEPSRIYRRYCEPVLYDLLLIDGFDRISHLQAQVFGGLAKHARSTIVSFDYVLPEVEADEDEYAAQRDLQEQSAHFGRNGAQGNEPTDRKPAMCESTASESVVPIRSADEIESPPQQFIVAESAVLAQTGADYQWKDTSFRELQSCMPSSVEVPPAVVRVAPGVECFTSLDRFIEMREIARRCKEAIATRRVNPCDILVIARSIDSYAGAVEAAFDDAGLDYFIDGSVKVAALAHWHFVRRLLSIPLQEYNRREVFDVLRSPYFNAEQAGIPPDMLSKLDRMTYKMELVGGLGAWQRFFELCPDLEAEKNAVLQMFDRLAALQAPLLSVYDRVTIAEEILETFMRLPANDRHSRTMKARMENELIRSLRRIFKNILMEECLLNARAETGEEFLQRLFKSAENASFARPVATKNGITICAADLAPSACFQEIYIAGMVEGDFPRRTVGRGLLASNQVARWLSYGIDLRNPRAEPGFERALFYSLLERARSKVVLSMPQFEMDGAESVPSFYLKELEESPGLTVVKPPLFAAALRRPVSVSEALAAATWIGDFDACQAVGCKDPAVAERVREIRSGFEAAISRCQAERNQVYNAYLHDFVSTGALQVPLPEAWTASKLNKFGQCPFRFWAGDILQMEPRDEPEPGLSTLVRGEIYHKILEVFFAAYRQIMRADQTGSLSNQDERDAVIAVLIEDAFVEGLELLEKKPLFAPGPWWQQEKKEMLFRITRFIKRELARISADDRRFAPALFEVQFGTSSPSSCPPLILHSQEESITIRGTIDRIDLQDGAIPAAAVKGLPVQVVDYKTGGKPISYKDALSGRNIQVPLYALAVEQAVLPGSSVLSGLYMSISQGKASGVLEFNAEKHASLPAHTVSLVADFVRRIKQGEFVPAPSSLDVCTHCPHRTACRVKELKGFTEADSDASD